MSTMTPASDSGHDESADEFEHQDDHQTQLRRELISDVNQLREHVEELDAAYDQVVDELQSLRLRVSELDEDRDYETLTREEKVGRVRQHAYDRARENTKGTASLDYEDIKWGVFGGDPSASHCYDLMRDAAELEGYEIKDPAEKNRHLRVAAADVTYQPTDLSAKNRRENGRGDFAAKNRGEEVDGS